MKLKLDKNIPASLKGELAAIGHDVETVVDEGLVGSSDERLWTRCQQEERLLVTQDLDFSDLRKFRPGTHAGLLLIRLQNPEKSKDRLPNRLCLAQVFPIGRSGSEDHSKV